MAWNEDRDPKEFQSDCYWTDFLLRWKDVQFVQEAVGMLHQAAHIDTNPMQRHKLLAEQVDFFLYYSQHGGEQMERTAQQLLLGTVLRASVAFDKIELLPTHEAVIRFLGER